MRPLKRTTLPVVLLLALGYSNAAWAQSGMLPSWNDGRAKKAIVEFVARVTLQGGPDYVPPSARIAVFDNDGTLWSEQPMYVQLAFALDRVRVLARQHPEWRDKQPFKAVLENDVAALAKSGERGLVELIMATHAGVSTDEFEKTAGDWLATARHPETGRLYTEMTYKPMLELLAYLRGHGFKTFIVSGGGVEFIRPWAEKTYGIPPEQVVGSVIKVKYEVRNGVPVLTRLPEIDFIDDKAGKPVGIHSRIGRKPIMAIGNSDGDFEMLEWATSSPGARLGVLLHHDDAARERAYDRKSHFGQLSRGLDDGPGRGWIVVSMKDDWACVFEYACSQDATTATPGK